MSTYGRTFMLSVGRSLQVSADGDPKAKAGGVTLDWSAVNVFAADDVFEDEDIVYAGEKFLRYGQIVVLDSATGKYIPYVSDNIARGDGYILNESIHENQPNSDHPPAIDGGRVWKKRLLVVGLSSGASQTGVNEEQTVTTGAGNTGGSFTITLSGQTTSALDHDATAAEVQSALEALSTIGVGNVGVSRTGSAGAGFVYTLVYKGALQDTNMAAVTTTPSLTGGADTAVVATSVEGTEGLARPTLAVFEAAFPNIVYVP